MPFWDLTRLPPIISLTPGHICNTRRVAMPFVVLSMHCVHMDSSAPAELRFCSKASAQQLWTYVPMTSPSFLRSNPLSSEMFQVPHSFLPMAHSMILRHIHELHFTNSVPSRLLSCSTPISIGSPASTLCHFLVTAFFAGCAAFYKKLYIPHPH